MELKPKVYPANETDALLDQATVDIVLPTTELLENATIAHYSIPHGLNDLLGTKLNSVTVVEGRYGEDGPLVEVYYRVDNRGAEVSALGWMTEDAMREEFGPGDYSCSQMSFTIHAGVSFTHEEGFPGAEEFLARYGDW